MCHPAPGPRCSAHAYAEYLHALRAYENATDAGEKLQRGENLAQKRAVYDSTPRGQRALARAQNGEEDFGVLLNLQQRALAGKELRQQQLTAYHTMLEVRSTTVRDALRADGVRGRYASAAGIAYEFLVSHRRDLTVEIEDVYTISLTMGDDTYKVLVLPQKYQHVWGEAEVEHGRYMVADDEVLTGVLNRDAGGAGALSADDEARFGMWFVGQTRAAGYHLFAAVNTTTEDVHLGLIDEVPDFVNFDLRVQVKQGGTTAYTGLLSDVKRELRGTVFADGQVRQVTNPTRTVVTGVPQQPKRFCHVGGLYLAWRDTEDLFEVRRRHVSHKVSLIVKTKHKATIFPSGLSNQALALIGSAVL